MAISSNNLNLMETLQEIPNRLDSMEQVLGKGLQQPFNAANSGARKNLYSTQNDHIVPLKYAEPPATQTGYENRYGDLSSSLIIADSDELVIAIIPKFSFAPKYNYYVITQVVGTDLYKIHHVETAAHTTQTYGTIYNNTYINGLNEGDIIPQGATIRKSTSYDDYGNRQDGVNLLCGYIATDRNQEDSLIFSETGRKKMTTVEVKNLTLILNDNDILLDLYGDGEEKYLSFPDIGEKIQKGLFTAVRRENKEEALFSQAINRLSNIMMSDKKITLEGTVIDITLKANNPKLLESKYNSQLNKYYNETVRFNKELVSVVENIKATNPNYKLQYDLSELYVECKMLTEGALYQKDGKTFTNAIMEVTIIHDKLLSEGDKAADRFGGKGVVSFVLPDYLMPRNEWGEVLDCIVSQPTCVNRLNPGQLDEISLNHIGSEITRFISMNVLTPRESMKLVLDFITAVVPEEGYALKAYTDSIQDDELAFMLDSIIRRNLITLSLRPITDNMTLDKLAAIYDLFPWVQQNKMVVPQEDSNGNIRYIEARRRIVIAHKYMHRLKQYSEDKFSSTSLSATNIKNQNTRNKASKNYEAIHSTTPVAQGNMEIDDLSHLGMEFVVTNLMIHSVSPQARRLCEQMLTGDPFNVDIKLDENSTNRSVEIFNTYMKTKGLRLVFSKTLKNKKPLVKFDLVCFDRNLVPQPLVKFVNENEVFDFDKYNDYLFRENKNLVKFDLVSFDEE